MLCNFDELHFQMTSLSAGEALDPLDGLSPDAAAAIQKVSNDQSTQHSIYIKNRLKIEHRPVDEHWLKRLVVSLRKLVSFDKFRLTRIKFY